MSEQQVINAEKRVQAQKKAENKAVAKAAAVKKADEEKAYAARWLRKRRRLMMRLMQHELPQNKLRE